jgi:copper ion binding protein
MNADKAQKEEILETREIGIAGMTCDHCANRVEKALRAVNGVKAVSVDRQAALASVTFDSALAAVAALHDAVLRSGYKLTASSRA